MATFVVAHGAWSAGWAWKKMHPLLRSLGHELFVPTYTGLGERSHLASPEVDLETHVADVLGHLHCEDHRGVILVGHSYGGMVATTVADRAADRIRHLVYLDAFVPQDGQSLNDLRPGQRTRGRCRRKRLAHARQPASGRHRRGGRRVDHGAAPRAPAQVLRAEARLTGAVEQLPRTYIYCTKPAPGDGFRVFARRAQTEPGWEYLEIQSSHNPHITVPASLARLLDSVAARVGD